MFLKASSKPFIGRYARLPAMSARVEPPELLVEVVSDDSVRRARLEEILRDEGLSPRQSVQAPECPGQPLLIVADGRLFDTPGRSLVGSLRAERRDDTRVIVCTDHVGRRELRRAIDEGLDGLVWESNVGRSLPPTVRAVLAGQLVIPRELRRRMENPKLSVREKQILSLVIMGLSNGEIAGRLFIGQSTVKTHLGSAYRKLGVSSRAEAARVITDPEEGLGTGILRISESAAPAPATGATPGEQAAGEMADQPYDAPHIGSREP
jgi:DNA-binding NarL/FixJ family response regulator